jgi:hypothetical protein
MMVWVRLIGGVVLVLLGLIRIGQGLDLIQGSGMSGHARYAVLGLAAALAGLWLVWGFVTTRARGQRS